MPKSCDSDRTHSRTRTTTTTTTFRRSQLMAQSQTRVNYEHTRGLSSLLRRYISAFLSIIPRKRRQGIVAPLAPAMQHRSHFQSSLDQYCRFCAFAQPPSLAIQCSSRLAVTPRRCICKLATRLCRQHASRGRSQQHILEARHVESTKQISTWSICALGQDAGEKEVIHFWQPAGCRVAELPAPRPKQRRIRSYRAMETPFGLNIFTVCRYHQAL